MPSPCLAGWGEWPGGGLITRGGMDCDDFGGASVPTTKEQDLRDLLHRHGLEVGPRKDVNQVVYEVLSAVFQAIPERDLVRLFASVQRSVSTPSPTSFGKKPFGGGCYHSPMSRITEDTRY